MLSGLRSFNWHWPPERGLRAVVDVLAVVLESERQLLSWLISRQPCRNHCSAYAGQCIAVMLLPTRIVSKADGMAAEERGEGTVQVRTLVAKTLSQNGFRT